MGANKHKNMANMAYKLESEDHVSMIKETFEQWTRSSPNIFFISSDGHKIFTQKIIISFYSPMLATIIESFNEEIGISVDASSSQIVSMMKVLTTGLVMAGDSVELEQVSDLAQSLGIRFKNWQIGSRRKPQAQPLTKKYVKKAKVNKVSNINNNVDKNSPLKSSTEVESMVKDSKLHFCDDCGKSFSRADRLTRHKIIHSGIRFVCNVCSWNTPRKDKLSKHIKEKHGDLDFEEIYKIGTSISNMLNSSGLKQEMDDENETKNKETAEDSDDTGNESDKFDENKTQNKEATTKDSEDTGNGSGMIGENEDVDAIEIDEDIDQITFDS